MANNLFRAIQLLSDPGKPLAVCRPASPIANRGDRHKHSTKMHFREVQDGGTSWLMGVWGKAKFPPVATAWGSPEWSPYLTARPQTKM